LHPKLISSRLWIEREVGRKIIDPPPNMGTKSDPKIKITGSKRKKEQERGRAPLSLLSSLFLSFLLPLAVQYPASLSLLSLPCCLNKKAQTTH